MARAWIGDSWCALAAIASKEIDVAEKIVVKAPTRVMLIYLGRRGLSRFSLDFVRAAQADESIAATIVVSRQNELFASFAELKNAHLAVSTYNTNAGALFQAWRVPIIRRCLEAAVAQQRPEIVIELMPHVWSSFIVPPIKAMGVRYVPIIHDAWSHPGDYRSASVAALAKRTLQQADRVVTLSGAVAGRIEASGAVPARLIIPLWHPDLDFGGQQSMEPPLPGCPLRLVFFGRIMAYKGLSLFLDMVDELRRRGLDVEVGVFGEGDLGANASRLSAMRAEVINRWLTEAEISTVLPRFHAMVLSHIESSQSGVAAAALGAGLPVIATPVGGIIEQVADGVTGLLAQRADSWALADAAEFLASNPTMYRHIRQNIMATREDRSMARFVRECVNSALAAFSVHP